MRERVCQNAITHHVGKEGFTKSYGASHEGKMQRCQNQTKSGTLKYLNNPFPALSGI